MATTTTETITKIQFRRGTTADRGNATLSVGEPGWDTDQKILYIGTGDPSEGPGVPCIQFSSEFEVGTDGVKINFDDSTGTGFNFTSFLSGVNSYLENNATDTEK